LGRGLEKVYENAQAHEMREAGPWIAVVVGLKAIRVHLRPSAAR
jgi:hypothetical protein